MHAYRSHTCGDLTAAHAGETVRLSGWFIGSATTAACCSSTCATITA